jgi:Glucodextranase, domain B/PASTA domain
VGGVRASHLFGSISGATVVAICVCACGGTARVPAAPVKLTFRQPTDGTRIEASAATVSGAVSPRTARVLVVGHTVKPDASGNFSTTVALAPGTNLIDVIASAAHARPAMTTLRVVRYVLVKVPDVTGESPTDAVAAIRDAGLDPQLHHSHNPFSFLVPLPQQVCNQSPSGGDHVAPHSTVTLELGKVCT